MSAVPMSPALVPISASAFLRGSASFGRSPALGISCPHAIIPGWSAIPKLRGDHLRGLLALRAGPAYDSTLLFPANSRQ